MAKEYIEQRGSGYYFIGSRVSLGSVVHGFLRGESPECINESFPSLSLEQVYGGIVYYLANKERIDAYLRETMAKLEELRKASQEAHPELFERLRAARRDMLSRR